MATTTEMDTEVSNELAPRQLTRAARRARNAGPGETWHLLPRLCISSVYFLTIRLRHRDKRDGHFCGPYRNTAAFMIFFLHVALILNKRKPRAFGVQHQRKCVTHLHKTLRP